MKKLLAVFLVLAFGLIGVASAQHRNGGWQNQRHGGWQHQRYDGGYYGGQRHHGGGYGWLAPLVIGAGVTYLVTRPVYVEPPVVYYEPLPRVVPAAQQPNGCHKETRKIFNENGQAMGAQVFLVCPVPSTTSPAPVMMQ